MLPCVLAELSSLLGIYQMMFLASIANTLDIRQPLREQGYLKLPLNHKEANIALEITCNPQNQCHLNVTELYESLCHIWFVYRMVMRIDSVSLHKWALFVLIRWIFCTVLSQSKS